MKIGKAASAPYILSVGTEVDDEKGEKPNGDFKGDGGEQSSGGRVFPQYQTMRQNAVKQRERDGSPDETARPAGAEMAFRTGSQPTSPCLERPRWVVR